MAHLIDLGAAFAAAAIWATVPQAGPWPLMLVLIGQIARAIGAPERARGTALDAPLALFLVSGVLGAVISFDAAAASQRLWYLVGGLTLYDAVAHSPEAVRIGRREVAVWPWLLTILPALIGLYSATTTRWEMWNGKWPWLNPARALLSDQSWLTETYQLHPTVAGGIIAVFLPIQWAQFRSPRTSRIGRVLAAAAILISLMALALTATRGAWIALSIVMGLALAASTLRWSKRRRSSGSPRQPPVGSAIALGAIVMAISLPVDLLRWIPVSLAGRPIIWQQSLDLISDYPLTGVGLGGFEMAYSTYVLLVHVGFLSHAHNILLNIWLNQGVLGVIALIWAVWLAWRAARGNDSGRWAKAGLAALAILLLHGTFDDALYGYDGRGSVLLFVPMALTVQAFAERRQSSSERHRVPWSLLAGIVLVGLLLLPATRSRWQSNLAAVVQTRVELSSYRWPEWPIQDALRRSERERLAVVMARYQAALALDQANASANRRLGQVELSLGEYEAARRHLEAAYREVPYQRATRQLLGESYAVTGDVELAVQLWQGLDLSQDQIRLREWWYREIGEPERAEQLMRALALLEP